MVGLSNLTTKDAQPAISEKETTSEMSCSIEIKLEHIGIDKKVTDINN
jgi:hypothetical protein